MRRADEYGMRMGKEETEDRLKGSGQREGEIVVR